MIRFTHPLVLIALVGLLALLTVVLRRRKGGMMRLIPVFLVLIALAGPQIGSKRLVENVIFLIDQSPSVALTTTDRILEEQMEAIVTANPDREYGAILFASQAAIADRVGQGIPEIEIQPSLGTATDLAGAVDLAVATLPEQGASQLVLLSDGQITYGRQEGISAAVAAGVQISTVLAGGVIKEDTKLHKLELPAEVELNRPFSIDVEVASEKGGKGMLILYRDSQMLSMREVSFFEGITRFGLTDTLSEGGVYAYQAVIHQPGDQIPENDSLSAIVRTSEKPSLLVISQEEPKAIFSLLEENGKPFAYSSKVPTLEELAGYQEVLLAGFALRDLTSQALETLESFVSDLGGGLVVVEGEQDLRGFAGGGIEMLLPVSYTLPQKARQASLCVVFLLDRSSSMRGHGYGASKIDILKEAAAASINLLAEETLVGVIAFDRDYDWLIPIQPVADGQAIYQGLRNLKAGGGTDIYYPVVEALNNIESIEARARHLIVLSDGKTVDEPRDFPGLISRLDKQDEITLSAIAIGPTPNLALLDLLVQAGNGTLYTASDYTSLPEISVQATQKLSRSRFVSGTIPVTGPLAEGVLVGLPPLEGYVLTYPKSTANVLLWAGSDPILSHWRLGLGQVAVLNADLSGQWSSHWLSWKKGALLFDSILATAESGLSPSPGLMASAEVGKEGIIALVDAQDQQGNFMNFLDLEATLLQSSEVEAMDQVGPGLYQTTFPPQEEGGYALRIADNTREISTTLPFSVPYPAEYRETGLDKESLKQIARATGGRYMEDEILPDTVARKETFGHINIHPHLLLTALALFLGELVVRKLPRRWLRLRRQS